MKEKAIQAMDEEQLSRVAGGVGGYRAGGVCPRCGRKLELDLSGSARLFEMYCAKCMITFEGTAGEAG